jgi:hypothetical protein
VSTFLGHGPCSCGTPMQATIAVSLAVVAALGAACVACGVAVDPGNTGGGGGGPVGGSSSGFVSSSSGSTGIGSSSGSTMSGSSSSGGPPPSSPECAGDPLPAIAMLCPDGTSAAPYYVWNGSQCVIAYQCPPEGVNPGGPIISSSSGSTTGSSSGTTSGVGPGTSSGSFPPPPVCDFPVPDICEACPNGETICAHYAIQNGSCVVEICPPASVPPPVGGSCAQGEACEPGSGCGTASTGNGCSTSCTCDSTGTYQCSTSNCVLPPPDTCAEGANCVPGSGCGTGQDAFGCFTTCSCSYATDTLECSYGCTGGGAVDASAADAAADAAFPGM